MTGNAARDAKTDRDRNQRDRWIMLERLAGRTQKSIAEQLGMAQGTISNVCRQYKRRQGWRYELFLARRQRQGLGRPVDMGGTRDVWLTYYPSPDPRLDIMEPVDGDLQTEPQRLEVYKHECETP